MFARAGRRPSTAICSRGLPPCGDVRPLKVPRFDFRRDSVRAGPLIMTRCSDKPNVFVFAFEQFRNRARGIPRPFLRDLGHRSPVRLEQRSAEPFLAKGDPAARESDEPFHPPFGQRQARDRAHSLLVPAKEEAARTTQSPANLGAPPSAEELLGRQTYQWMQQRFRDSNLALERRIGVDLHALGYFGDPSAEVDRPQRARLLQHLKNRDHLRSQLAGLSSLRRAPSR